MERADVEVCDIWLEMSFYYWISIWDIFSLDVFYWMFLNQASDMAGLSDHTLDISATIIIIAATIKASCSTKHVWACMNECRSRGDRGDTSTADTANCPTLHSTLFQVLNY